VPLRRSVFPADDPHAATPFEVSTFRQNGAMKTMATNTGSTSDELHSGNHSKLSAEEIAKALARHNKNHTAAHEANVAAKAKKAAKH
jgi:hypothetical protein